MKKYIRRFSPAVDWNRILSFCSSMFINNNSNKHISITFSSSFRFPHFVVCFVFRSESKQNPATLSKFNRTTIETANVHINFNKIIIGLDKLIESCRFGMGLLLLFGTSTCVCAGIYIPNKENPTRLNMKNTKLYTGHLSIYTAPIQYSIRKFEIKIPITFQSFTNGHSLGLQFAQIYKSKWYMIRWMSLSGGAFLGSFSQLLWP